MYRSSLEGLTEQIRSLEEQKRHLEGDLVGLGRMRRPQRLLRVAVGALLFVGVGACAGALGYRHAALQLGEASRNDAKAAPERIEVYIERCPSRRSIELCNERCPSQRSAASMGF